MANDDVQTNLRIPSELKDRLQASATDAGRSLSAEVAFRIGRAFELETLTERLRAELESGTKLLESVTRDIRSKTREVQASMREVAALEAQLKLLGQTHESNIAAATKFLSEKAEAMTARAAAAEKALEAQTRVSGIVAHFVVELADLVPASDGSSLKTSLQMIKHVGAAIRDGHLSNAVEAAQALVGHGVSQGLFEADGKTPTPKLLGALDAGDKAPMTLRPKRRKSGD